MNFREKQIYMQWVRRNHPAVFKRAMGYAIGQNLGALTQAEQMAVEDAYVINAPDTVVEKQGYEKVLDMFIKTAKDILPTATAVYQEKKLMEINFELAKQGKPLLSKTDFAAQFNVGVPKDVQYILWAGIGLLGVFLITKMRR